MGYMKLPMYLRIYRHEGLNLLNIFLVKKAELFKYFTIKESSMRFPLEKFSLIFQALVELIVGFTYILNLGSLLSYPVILFLIPALMSLRGAIYGVLALKLTTLLYLGKSNPSFKDSLVRVEIFFSFLRSLFASFILAILAFAFDQAFFEKALDIGMLTTLALLTNLLTFLIVAMPTTAIMFYFFKKGRAIEFIGTPFVSSFADLATPVILFLSIPLSLILEFQVIFLISLISFLIAFFVFISLNVNRRKLYFGIFKSKDYRESFHFVSLMHTFYATISGLGGLFYARTIKFKEIQELLITVPAYNALLGSLGGIISSKASLSLHLEAKLRSWKNIKESYLALISLFIALFIVSSFTNIRGIYIVIVSAIYTSILMVLLALYASLIEYKRNFDPDTYTFPMISSLGDLVAPASILLTFYLIGFK